MERWFAELTRKQLRRGVHTSRKQLETDIRTFIEYQNQIQNRTDGQNPQMNSSRPLKVSVKRLSEPYAANFRFI